MFYSLPALLEIMLAEGAQGLHLFPGEKPVVEVNRTLFRVSGPALEGPDMTTLLRQIASADEFREFKAMGIVSCYHHIPGKAPLHVMAFRECDRVRLEFRSVQ